MNTNEELTYFSRLSIHDLCIEWRVAEMISSTDASWHDHAKHALHCKVMIEYVLTHKYGLVPMTRAALAKGRALHVCMYRMSKRSTMPKRMYMSYYKG